MQCLHECNTLFELNYILSNARGIRHDDACREALHVVRQIGGGAISAIASRIATMLLVARAARVELEHALGLAAECAE